MMTTAICHLSHMSRRLARSKTLKPIDPQPVWSVVCFFIGSHARRKGVGHALLRAAVALAADHGAKIVEGYPQEPRKDDVPAPFIWTGLAESFRRAGFEEVARRSAQRPIMRRGT